MKKAISAFFLIASVALVSCDRSEDEARILLNQALSAWQAGQFELADQKFQEINISYLSTQAATEAIQIRSQLMDEYQRQFDPTMARESNQGNYSRTVVEGIENFFMESLAYPGSLTDIEISMSRNFLEFCDYSKAAFELGYQLNCAAADVAYQSSRRSRQNAARQSSIQNSPNTTVDFPTAGSTWGGKFNPSGEVPEEGFYAFYFNTQTPDFLIHKETVDSVSINYAWDDFMGIKSEDFGAYWVGQIQLSQPETKTFAISQSWAKTRVLVDGFVVYEGGSDKEMKLDLEGGTHLIEVEYINNWHTTEFSMSILERLEKFSMAEIRAELLSKVNGDYALYYGGVYESSSKDLSTVLNITRLNKPIVLVLSSYSAVKWHINNPHNTSIKAIVVGSFSPGAMVMGDVDSDTLVIHSEERAGSYRLEQSCVCHAGFFHCEGGDGFTKTLNTLKTISDASLAGFSGEYASSSLIIPQIVINEAFYAENERARQQVIEDRATCTAQSNPDFEDMFQ